MFCLTSYIYKILFWDVMCCVCLNDIKFGLYSLPRPSEAFGEFFRTRTHQCWSSVSVSRHVWRCYPFSRTSAVAWRLKKIVGNRRTRRKTFVEMEPLWKLKLMFGFLTVKLSNPRNETEQMVKWYFDAEEKSAEWEIFFREHKWVPKGSHSILWAAPEKEFIIYNVAWYGERCASAIFYYS